MAQGAFNRDNRHSPLGFYNLAEDFYRSAIHIAAGTRERHLRLHFQDNVSYYLHTHSIELTLKAFLRAKNITPEDLAGKNLRHRLDKIFTKAIELKLRVAKPKHTEAITRRLGELAGTQTFRYFETRIVLDMPVLDEVRLANERLLIAVKPVCVKR